MGGLSAGLCPGCSSAMRRGIWVDGDKSGVQRGLSANNGNNLTGVGLRAYFCRRLGSDRWQVWGCEGVCSKHAVWPRRDAGRHRTSHAAPAPYEVAERVWGGRGLYWPSLSRLGRSFESDVDWLICKRNGNGRQKHFRTPPHNSLFSNQPPSVTNR
jgi:hypothetical protein